MNQNGVIQNCPKETEDFDRDLASRSKRFACEICQKQYSSKHCLNEHLNRHLDIKVYKCNICFTSFRYASQLSLHKKSHSNLDLILMPKLEGLERIHAKSEIRNVGKKPKIELPLISGPRPAVLPILDYKQ